MNETNFTINRCLFDSYLERMNFLNEISIDYPDAISFGSGRPDKAFFNVKDVISCVHIYEEVHRSRQQANQGQEAPEYLEAFYNSLGQYNKTKGIINEAIAKLLQKDENINVHPEDIIITNGAQEAMAIIIDTLFEPADRNGILLVSDPSYIGFVGYAKIAGVPIVPIERNRESICLDHLENTILRLKKEGKHPKVLYEVTDFHNPTGAYMPREDRKQLIRMADEHNFLIVEDNPYGYFRYDTEKIPTLKALDTCQRVLHIGSFAKTIFPSLRLGYLVADQTANHNGRRTRLAEEFKKTKSFMTVNTSTLLQAMVGGFLHRENYSLVKSCLKKVDACRKKRDTMIGALERQYTSPGSGTGNIKWSKPGGGFFLVLDVPFKVTDELLKECVEHYSVIFCPMPFFCLEQTEQNQHQIRLAFSNLSAEKIQQGIQRLADFIKAKM